MDRSEPDTRAELQRLADERAVALKRRTIHPVHGMPMDVAPCSYVGGDVPQNRPDYRGE